VKCSVIVTTYDATRPLDLALCGISRQSRRPDEVIVADDGSTAETAALLATWKESLPLHHVWQIDKGFRKCRIVNAAVRQSTGDHLIFLDGDTIPHRHWVADHCAAANGKRVLCGRRVRLGPNVSTSLTRDAVLTGALERLFGPVLRSRVSGETKRYSLGMRLPQWIARICHPRARRLMGVNFSLPRTAFETVNGMDQAEGIVGREDFDLGARLERAGFPFYPLLNRAVVYHLYHPERAMDAKTNAWRDAQAKSDRVRCELGLDQPFDPNE